MDKPKGGIKVVENQENAKHYEELAKIIAAAIIEQLNAPAVTKKTL